MKILIENEHEGRRVVRIQVWFRLRCRYRWWCWECLLSVAFTNGPLSSKATCQAIGHVQVRPPVRGKLQGQSVYQVSKWVNWLERIWNLHGSVKYVKLLAGRWADAGHFTDFFPGVALTSWRHPTFSFALRVFASESQLRRSEQTFQEHRGRQPFPSFSFCVLHHSQVIHVLAHQETWCHIVVSWLSSKLATNTVPCLPICFDNFDWTSCSRLSGGLASENCECSLGFFVDTCFRTALLKPAFVTWLVKHSHAGVLSLASYECTRRSDAKSTRHGAVSYVCRAVCLALYARYGWCTRVLGRKVGVHWIFTCFHFMNSHPFLLGCFSLGGVEGKQMFLPIDANWQCTQIVSGHRAPPTSRRGSYKRKLGCVKGIWLGQLQNLKSIQTSFKMAVC